jgi:hypothetical protein
MGVEPNRGKGYTTNDTFEVNDSQGYKLKDESSAVQPASNGERFKLTPLQQCDARRT